MIVLASDLALVEFVDDQNRPVPVGTPSTKALITNLFNPTQPLIRYELNDSFVQHPDSPDHGHLRVTVEGRSNPPFRYGNVVVPAIAIGSILLSNPAIIEYQVRQTVHGIHLDIVAPNGIDQPALRQSLASALTTLGLEEADATCALVPAIKRNPLTANAPRFIPLQQQSPRATPDS